MLEVLDKGKVWFPGSSKPVFALRVGSTVFVPGKEEEFKINYRISDNSLCVDLHNSNKKIRIARKFPLELIPKKMAILFSGFEKTKHSEIKVVTYEDPKVKHWEIKGKEYIKEEIEFLNNLSFLEKAKF